MAAKKKKQGGYGYTVEEFLKENDDWLLDPEDMRLNPSILPTDLESLDLILGGGMRRGRSTMIYGVESSGKTLLTQLIIASAQRRGGRALFMDAERTYDPAWFRQTGVDTTNKDVLAIGRPKSLEHCFDKVEQALQTKAYDVIVIDSLPALVSKALLDTTMEEQDQMGGDARKITQGMKKLNLANESTVLIIINQMRSALSVTYGNPETIPGGHYLRHSCSVFLRLRKGGWILDKEVDDSNVVSFSSVPDDKEGQRIGFNMKVRVEKNKTTIPWQETQIRVLWDGSIDATGSLVDLAIKRGIIILEKGYSFYRVPGHESLINGRENVADYLRENEEARTLIAAAVRGG